MRVKKFVESRLIFVDPFIMTRNAEDYKVVEN